jgi:hypothetical protein
MELTRPKLPSEAIRLYNLFIHGEISRRDFMDGVQRFAIGGLTAATIVEALMPNYALGQQVQRPMTASKPPTRTFRRRRGTEASRDILFGLSALTREPRRQRNCPALSWSTRTAV